MANLLLLPGFGDAYTSTNFIALSYNSVGTDTLDMSRVSSFAVQLSTTASGTGVQIQQTFDMSQGGNWVNFGSIVTSLTLFDITDGPFGVIRLGSVSAINITSVKIVGFPTQTLW